MSPTPPIENAGAQPRRRWYERWFLEGGTWYVGWFKSHC